MSATQQRRLGEVAYHVHADGSISRTVVNSLGVDGAYGFLEHSHGLTFFDIEAAIAQAKDIFGKKEAELTRELTKIRAKLAVLDTGGYRKDLAEAPLHSVSGSMIGAAFRLDGSDILEVAKKMLVDTFAEETGGTLTPEQVRLVSHQEEQAAERASSEKIASQVRKQFERLSGGD